MRTSILIATALAACTPAPQVRELSNPSINALMAQPVPQFFATLRLANEIARACPAYRYDETIARAVTDARTRSEAGGITALQNRGAIALESDVTLRSFQARHEGLDTCAAAAREIADQTAVSAVLVAR